MNSFLIQSVNTSELAESQSFLRIINSYTHFLFTLHCRTTFIVSSSSEIRSCVNVHRIQSYIRTAIFSNFCVRFMVNLGIFEPSDNMHHWRIDYLQCVKYDQASARLVLTIVKRSRTSPKFSTRGLLSPISFRKLFIVVSSSPFRKFRTALELDDSMAIVVSSWLAFSDKFEEFRFCKFNVSLRLHSLEKLWSAVPHFRGISSLSACRKTKRCMILVQWFLSVTIMLCFW